MVQKSHPRHHLVRLCCVLSVVGHDTLSFRERTLEKRNDVFDFEQNEEVSSDGIQNDFPPRALSVTPTFTNTFTTQNDQNTNNNNKENK